MFVTANAVVKSLESSAEVLEHFQKTAAVGNFLYVFDINQLVVVDRCHHKLLLSVLCTASMLMILRNLVSLWALNNLAKDLS
jgi:hypothetical protein